jgi:acyl-CoA synthetase (AMP-forming)/AMP-acid ligase II/peptidoglycan/LPS O-acetylase OafA/YrhL
MEFVDRFTEHSHRPALIFPDRAPISYAELDRRVTALANDFGPGKKLITLLAEPTEHAVIAYLAALRANHAVALLPPCQRDALDDFIADFSPDIVCGRMDGRWRCQPDTSNVAGDLHADLAVLLGTSGSTGKSRFVRLAASAVEANARAIGTYLELGWQDRAALILPFHYSYGLSVLNSHLAVGASIYFPARGAADAGFAEEIAGAGCTNISGVPYSYELMEKTGFRKHELPALRFMTVAGGRMSPDMVETFQRHLADNGKRFFVMYGQTEATARIAYVPPDRLPGNNNCIGVAIPGGALRLLDDEGRPIKRSGEPGELVYRGPNVMMGYASARADLARGAEIAELRTGDIAERDAQGFYRIVGRRKRMSKIAGLRINHEAIEAALSAAGITAAVAGDDERLLALVAPPHSDDGVLNIMMAASGLPRPRLEVARTKALPRLASGKVDFSAVAARLQETRPQPNGGIMEAFRRAFYPRHVSPNDSFETLGGDSLLYVQLSLSLEQELGRLPEDWETMSVAALCRTGRKESERKFVDSQLFLRAAAILLIVVHHATLWPLPGGAATLVMLVGYGLARFQRQRLFAGDMLGVLRPVAVNLAIYAPIVAGFSLARGEILWPSVFLVGNLGLVAPAHMLPYLYWFVEAYVQTVLLWVVLFSAPLIRRVAHGSPFGFGLLLLALSVAAKFLTPLVWNIGGAQIFTLPDVFYLAVLGWCLYFADTAAKRQTVALIAALLCPLLAWWGGNWTGSWVKFTLVLVAALVLLYAPRVAMPRWLAQLILPISAASYHIYLFHRILPELLLPHPDPAMSRPAITAVAIVSGVAVGLAAFAVQKHVLGFLTRRRADVPAIIREEMHPIRERA